MSANADGSGSGCTGPGPCQTGNELVGKDVPVFASPLLQKGVDLEILRFSERPLLLDF